ncbi:PepSY-associated TM helix domain-containing protein [Hymenobacter lapidiphilus]|uniref:PepSY domain-containing protein n=1 Tax=Hymenobacter lapidiphilus TaxID=2608003 RepID=A0A7Y7U522_9BACT|nr:PepSY-associated TM helix domain-containing protein [Hymenobacter lapidiphilus]NVO30867.1 PepSY domain-containing protein [Hymenobacter lapidiphilus]
MTFKKISAKLHLWLGLSSGLVVFIVSLTGCIFVFQDEIRDLTEPWRQVQPQPTAMLLPSRLQAAALATHPGVAAQDTWFTSFGPARSATVFFTDKAGTPTQVYLNPYSGQVLHEHDLRTHFFTIIQEIHTHLLLPAPVAKWVVGLSICIFVVMLLTGIVLWWPKRKQERKQRFTVKWGGRWRRMNYDLHNVLGFYAASIALVLALSGLFMLFPWMLNVTVFAIDGKWPPSPEQLTPKIDTLQTVAAAARPLPDVAYSTIYRLAPETHMLIIAPVGSGKATLQCWAYQRALHYYHRTEFFFHPTSGQLLGTTPHHQKSNGTKFSDMNYDLHTGQLLGLGGKIVAFLASLISASLPVTGTIVWWGRRNKKQKPQRLQPA